MNMNGMAIEELENRIRELESKGKTVRREIHARESASAQDAEHLTYLVARITSLRDTINLLGEVS